MRIFVFLLALFAANPSHAETDVRDFLLEYNKATEDGKRLLDSFLSGLVVAYGWSNVTLKAEGLPPHFCPNARFAKEIEEPIRMVRRMASADPQTLDAPVGAALRYFAQGAVKRVDHFLVTFALVRRLERVHVCKAGPGDGLHFQRGVQLHGARTKGNHRPI